MSLTHLPVAIAGGGIGGLACALGLAQRGFRVMVLEQARALGEIGVGLQVAPNALAVLDALGVKQRAIRSALLIERMRLMDGVSGECIVDIPCGKRFQARYGQPYAVAHRADVHGALLEACQAHPDIGIRTASRVTGFDEQDGGVSVRLESGERVAARALVGADGVNSRVRRALLDDGEPMPSGAIIYRATIPAERMPRDLRHPFPTLWAGPGNHIIYYPISDWTLFNFAVTVHTGQTSADEANEAKPEEPLTLCEGCFDTPLRVMRLVPSFRRWLIRRREPVDTWSRGRVTLLGDAAHPMVQYIAQGAAQALEDAICLAESMREVVREGGGGVEAAFALYQQRRLPRATRVQSSSWAMHQLLHARGAERLARNSIFAGRTPAQSYERLDWLYTAPDYVRPA